MGSMNADELIGVSSSWGLNRKWIYNAAQRLVFPINAYKEVLLKGSKEKVEDCYEFLKDKEWNDTKDIRSSQNVNDIYEVLCDISDVSADLFYCMSESDDVQKYLDDAVFEGIFFFYKELYGVVVQEIVSYEYKNNNNRKNHNLADAVVWMYSALRDMDLSYMLVTRDVGGSEKYLDVPEELIEFSDELARRLGM